MKITDIKVTNLVFSYPNSRGFRYAGGVATGRVTSLVHVFTDDGIVGLGTGYSHPELLRTIIDGHLKPHLLSRNPLETDLLWELMYRLTRWYGRKGVAMSALGALDIAFWDLRGKKAGKPIFELLGSSRSSVPAYASGLFWRDDINDLQREARIHMRNGFRRVKMRLGRNEEYDRAALEAVLRGVSPDGEVMVDGSHQYTIESATRFGEFLSSKRNVFWFEEPFAPEDIDSYVALRKKVSTPLAAGENEFGVQGFRELLQAGAIDIVQADASRAGGITECIRIGQLAANSNSRFAPHTWSDAVAVMANAHVVAALKNGLTVEVDQTGNPFIDKLLGSPLRIIDGQLQLPRAPGLGIELDQNVVKSLTLPENSHVPDGNYSDMIFGPNYA